jgi:hypothetical protein
VNLIAAGLFLGLVAVLQLRPPPQRLRGPLLAFYLFVLLYIVGDAITLTSPDLFWEQLGIAILYGLGRALRRRRRGPHHARGRRPRGRGGDPAAARGDAGRDHERVRRRGGGGAAGRARRGGSCASPSSPTSWLASWSPCS